MKTEAGRLYDTFIGSKGHIGNVRVRVEKVLEKVPGIDYTDLDKTPSTINVKALFDTGSDGGAMTSRLYENHDITNLDKKIIKLTTTLL
mgnify:CR=1 FL=1